MEGTYVQLINCRLHPFRSSASSFSSQYLLLFLKSSKSYVLLPTPFTSVICPSMASWRRQFLLRIWPIHLAFLRRILFIISVLFSTIRSRICSLVTFSDHLIFSILLQHHISKLSKCFRSNFLLFSVYFTSGRTIIYSINLFRKNYNLVVFPMHFHIFMPLANWWLIRLQGQFPILRTRSCPDLYPLIL